MKHQKKNSYERKQDDMSTNLYLIVGGSFVVWYMKFFRLIISALDVTQG